MPFPENIDELRTAGYVSGGKSTCKCGASLHWWTTPKGKKMPMNTGTAKPHFATCPLASSFRKKEPKRCPEVAMFHTFKIRCTLASGHTSNHRDESGNAWATS